MCSRYKKLTWIELIPNCIPAAAAVWSLSLSEPGTPCDPSSPSRTPFAPFPPFVVSYAGGRPGTQFPPWPQPPLAPSSPSSPLQFVPARSRFPAGRTRSRTRTGAPVCQPFRLFLWQAGNTFFPSFLFNFSLWFLSTSGDPENKYILIPSPTESCWTFLDQCLFWKT